MITRQRSITNRALHRWSGARLVCSATRSAYKIRLCRDPLDFNQVADICASVFVHERFSQQLSNDSADSLRGIIDSYTERVRSEVHSKLEQNLAKKKQAAAAAREYRAYRRHLEARHDTEAPAEPEDYRRQAQRWASQRMLACLVAEDVGTGRLVGCANISMMQPEALLPPPMPSGAPLRAYVSNMAVLPSCRRQGVASALLAACERLAACWQHDSLWLHVNSTNAGAQQLYSRLGYSRAPGAGGFMGLLPGSLKELLLAKELRSGSGNGGKQQQGAAAGQGAVH